MNNKQFALYFASYSTFGVLVSSLSFFISLYVFVNAHAAIWSFASALCALANLHLHMLYLRESLGEWYTEESLNGARFVGLAVILSGFGFFIWYCFNIIYYGYSIDPIQRSLALGAVWALVCAHWGSLLFHCVKRYQQLLLEIRVPLLSS